MPAPAQVVQWVQRSYPRPQVAAEWLNDCYDYVLEEMNLSPAMDLQRILDNVESQLLQSDLRDSMIPGTGLPLDISEYNGKRLRGPVLVEVTAITDIGHSAFSLQNVRQTRLDKADLAGLGQEDDEEEGPIPRYPHSMLRFELSDGNISVGAIEYRKLPQLVLGQTPLGFKIILQDVLFRRGIAFLEPSSVILKGYETKDRENSQDFDFIRGLRLRMGLPDIDPPENTEEAPAFEVARDSQPEQQSRAIAGPSNVPARNIARSPLAVLSVHPVPSSSSTLVGDGAEDCERKRKTPISQRTTTSLPSNQGTRPGGQRSHYFTQNSTDNPCEQLASENILSPPPTSYSVFVKDETDQVGQNIPSSDGFDDDSFQWDEAALEHLSEVEKNAALKHGSGAGCLSAATSSSAGSTSASRSAESADVVEIDDDEDDKENVAMQYRRVRRRPPMAQVADDVIEISD
ncbi:hypothetical protein NEOLEDRAFT_1166674 [Neolentinus lepideus HHB14362 ss-1]|uniref:RecQ-mediated genome instability protein 1 n=1 Tax=Neolentinus lepideus HHB14362 ss-1 TaxID=1314782 RepID=A0A165VL32_9AGAM|nr:hypothetical protein NEOLEDRAFT_1166674 [Neolentinus lepideus HHB14362 ss-1]